MQTFILKFSEYDEMKMNALREWASRQGDFNIIGTAPPTEIMVTTSNITLTNVFGQFYWINEFKVVEDTDYEVVEEGQLKVVEK